jgi:hypothetical protein
MRGARKWATGGLTVRPVPSPPASDRLQKYSLLVRLLLEAGAKATARDGRGHTPLTDPASSPDLVALARGYRPAAAQSPTHRGTFLAQMQRWVYPGPSRRIQHAGADDSYVRIDAGGRSLGRQTRWCPGWRHRPWRWLHHLPMCVTVDVGNPS